MSPETGQLLTASYMDLHHARRRRSAVVPQVSNHGDAMSAPTRFGIKGLRRGRPRIGLSAGVGCNASRPIGKANEPDNACRPRTVLGSARVGT